MEKPYDWVSKSGTSTRKCDVAAAPDHNLWTRGMDLSYGPTISTDTGTVFIIILIRPGVELSKAETPAYLCESRGTEERTQILGQFIWFECQPLSTQTPPAQSPGQWGLHLSSSSISCPLPSLRSVWASIIYDMIAIPLFLLSSPPLSKTKDMQVRQEAEKDANKLWWQFSPSSLENDGRVDGFSG